MTGKIKKIISIENGDSFVADIEDIENRITQNSSNLESAKQELSNKCNEALSQAKAYTDTEKAKLFNSTNGTFTGQEYFRNSDEGLLRFNGGNTHDGGASLQLYAKNPNQDVYQQGVFDLVACTKEDASDAKQLIGTPAGSLTWNGRNIVRSVNSVNADASGNVQLGNIGGITGEIKWFAFNTVPDGYIICNGAKVSRTTYADLFAAIGTAFGDGDGSTTFDLPDLIDRFAQGSRTVGTYKSAGLPNITGYIGTSVPGNGNVRIIGNGAFTPDTSLESYNILFENASFKEEKEPFYTKYSFNASRSSSIYGNSATVQPPALTLLPCIKY